MGQNFNAAGIGLFMKILGVRMAEIGNIGLLSWCHGDRPES